MTTSASFAPCVSIVINNFNYGRFLNACIDSARRQTYPMIEIIVVDDGSQDESRTILKSQTPSVTVILKENGGQASACNAGFAASVGELVLFLDADDLLAPTAVETVVDLWRPEFSKFHFPLRLVDAEGTLKNLTVPRGKLSSGDVRREILAQGSYGTPPGSGNVYSRSLLRKVMPIPDLQWRKGADAYLITQAGFNGMIGSFEQPLGFYRIHGSSLSTVVQGNTVSVDQIRYLIDLNERSQSLVQELAGHHRLTPRRNILMNNLPHLKLLLASTRISGRYTAKRFVATAGLALRTMSTALFAKRNSIASRLQMMLWAVALTLAPRRISIQLIRVAFDTSPSSKCLAVLRGA